MVKYHTALEFAGPAADFVAAVETYEPQSDQEAADLETVLGILAEVDMSNLYVGREGYGHLIFLDPDFSLAQEVDIERWFFKKRHLDSPFEHGSEDELRSLDGRNWFSYEMVDRIRFFYEVETKSGKIKVYCSSEPNKELEIGIELGEYAQIMVSRWGGMLKSRAVQGHTCSPKEWTGYFKNKGASEALVHQLGTKIDALYDEDLNGENPYREFLFDQKP